MHVFLRNQRSLVRQGQHMLINASYNGTQYQWFKNDGVASRWAQREQPVSWRSDSVRHFTTTHFLCDKEPLKPSSKVEATVQNLKQQASCRVLDEKRPQPPPVVVQKTLKQKIIDELVHYYHGFRLLFIDIKISSGLCFRLLQGKTLTRREHRLLVRTVGDMFRLVPFSVFVIVPFMEFTLPIFIKFFPGMLPTTFQTAKDVEDKMKQSLKVKLEMAKFLQKTLDDMAVQAKDHKSQAAKEFSEWFHKVRTTGATVSNADILKYSKLFEDEITLDSLSRGQLVALCRVLEVNTLGTNHMLRYQLRMKLRSLAADDKVIQKEGLNLLTLAEVQQACKARGMRAYGLPEVKLREQLAQWIDLSLNQKVPPSLLLLSRALMLPETTPTEDKLKATILSLPADIVTQTKAAIGEKEGKIDNKVKLEVLKEEERRMKEERREAELADPAPVLSAANERPLADTAPTCSHKDFEVLEDALDHVAKDKKTLIVEKEEIQDLKEEMADYKEDIIELHEVTTNMTAAALPPKESKAARRLYNKVSSMIVKMDTVLNQLERKETALKEHLQRRGDATSEELIRIDELMGAIRKLLKVPDDTRLHHIERVLGKIDDDRDGAIKVEDVLKVIEVIGKENVQLSAKQVDELIELIEKEELLEVEDKIEKALSKEKNQKKSSSGDGPEGGGGSSPPSPPPPGAGAAAKAAGPLDPPSGTTPPPPPLDHPPSNKHNASKVF